jgi:hypothetical protein
VPRRLDIIVPIGDTDPQKSGVTSFVVGDDDDHESFQSVAEALEGDKSRLYRRLRSGARLSQNECDLLEGKLKGARKRPAKRSTYSRDFKVAYLVRYYTQLGGVNPGTAVQKAQEAFGLRRRAILAAIAKVENNPGRKMLLEAVLQDKVFSEDEVRQFVERLRWRVEMSVTWHKEPKD